MRQVYLRENCELGMKVIQTVTNAKHPSRLDVQMGDPLSAVVWRANKANQLRKFQINETISRLNQSISYLK